MPIRSPVTLFAISTLIWGSTWYAIKFQLGVVSPDVSVAYRFALAALLLGAWCVVTGRSLRFDVRTHAFIALQGVMLFGFNYVARLLGRAVRDVGPRGGAVLDDRVHEPASARTGCSGRR